MPYQTQLDAASYCNFMTRTTSEALLLITNALTSLSTHEFDTASKETLVSAISAPSQAPPPPPSSETRMESMFTQLLAGFTKVDSKYDSLSTKLESKHDSLYTYINSKFDNLRSHISELSPPLASINAVTLRSGKQLNPILQRESSARTSSIPVVGNVSLLIDTSGCRSTPINLDDSVLTLSSGIDNFVEEALILDGIERHPPHVDHTNTKQTGQC